MSRVGGREATGLEEGPRLGREKLSKTQMRRDRQAIRPYNGSVLSGGWRATREAQGRHIGTA